MLQCERERAISEPFRAWARPRREGVLGVEASIDCWVEPSNDISICAQDECRIHNTDCQELLLNMTPSPTKPLGMHYIDRQWSRCC